MKVSELLESIRTHDLVLPEFQREYVWNREQAKQLLVSLVKEYPVGGLLFWKTENPPELKNLRELPEKLGTIEVILDGQQRLTTLYLLMRGEIPPYYTDRDIQTDPRDLYYNIESGDFQYYQSSRMKGNPLWVRVVDCFTSQSIDVFEVAQNQTNNATDKKAFDLAKNYQRNLDRLRTVQNSEIPVQTVPAHATLEESINIFDRVNSLGTKLTDAELALTHITGKWSQARQIMKSKITEMGKVNFEFDLTFMTRALAVVATQRALYEIVHPQPKETLLEGWRRLSKILDYLVTILPQRAFIHSTQDVNTTNVLIPLVLYLSINDTKFPSDTAMKHAVHWLYAAHTWSRYTSQTDQRLEQDVSLIVREANPWNALRDQIIDQRGRIDVKASDLEGRGIEHPLYRMSLILAKAQGAVDWFNGAPLVLGHGKAYGIHSHHIFPQSQLYKNGFDRENHLHRKVINEIANRAFLTADTNLDLADRLPEQYFPDVEARYPGSLVKQFIPMDTKLWQLERYTDFLQARRELIARKINEFMAALISEPQIVYERPIGELISIGESATLEFKSTLQWDVVQNKQSTNLRHEVMKSIAAFLNSGGGTLVIGVEDNGSVYGLDNDLKVARNSVDGFQQLLAALIKEQIGVEFSPYIKIRFESIDDKQVCVLDMDKAPEPVFLNGSKGREFYVRLASTSRSLDVEETVSYININWA